jgi:hypothetical protein
MTSQLLRFTETFRGSSFPTLAEVADGRSLVLKMKGAGNGVMALLAEFMVNRLMHLAGLPVPDACVVQIPQNFPWEFGTDEFHDLVMKSGGANLALEWLGRTTTLPVSRYASLSPGFVSQVVTIDLTFSNFDRSAHSGNLVGDRAGCLWIVDHGSCRFLSPLRSVPDGQLPPGHIFSGREDAFDEGWLRSITPAVVASVVAEIPDDWLRDGRMTRDFILRELETRLRRNR